MNLPEKHRIRNAFARAADSYDAAAVLQRAVCDRLLQLLPETLPLSPPPGRILDAGCGTGYGARLLARHWPGAGIVATDFAERMVRMAAPDVPGCCVADIEALPFGGNHFDLWWSSLTVQWCNIDRVLNEAGRVLTPGGRVALSTLGAGTFAELRDAFAGIDHNRHTLEFSSPEQLADAARTAGLQDIAVHRQTMAAHYPDLRSLLRGVKAIGANTLGAGRRTGMMGRNAWQALAAAYEQHRTPDGLPASYDVIFLTARK